MDPKILWLVFLIILSLVQVVFLLVKARKNNPDKYGERIAALEKGQGEIERRLEKIEEKLNEG